jgi:WD40 repeat protein
MANSLHWLDLSEYLAIAASIVGTIAAVSSATWMYAIIPIVISLILNAINRLRLTNNLRQRQQALGNRMTQELQQQGEVFKQEIAQARSFSTALVKQTLAAQKAEPPALSPAVNPQEIKSLEQKFDLQKRLMESMQQHVAGVEGGLKDVVDLLDSNALADRVEYLERNLTSLSQQLGLEPEEFLAAPPRDRDNRSSEPPEMDISPLLEMISEDLVSGDIVSEQAISGDLSGEISSELSGDLWEKPTWSLSQTINAHSDWVRCLTFTPDGGKLVSGSFDKTIKLWNLERGMAIYTFTDHPKGVFALAISPNGKYLASGSWDEIIKLWDLDTGTLMSNLSEHQASVRSLVMSPDSQTLVSGSFDRTMKLWHLPDGKVTQTIVDEEPIAAIALSPDGKLLASTGDDGKIKIWSLASGKEIVTLTGNKNCVCALTIGPDSQTIAAGTVNGYAIFWHLGGDDNDLRDIPPLQSIKAHAGQINSCVFSPNGQYLITGSVDGKAKVWYKGEDIAFRDKARSILKGDPGRSVMSVAIDLQGRSIAVGGADGTIQIWQQV